MVVVIILCQLIVFGQAEVGWVQNLFLSHCFIFLNRTLLTCLNMIKKKYHPVPTNVGSNVTLF